MTHQTTKNELTQILTLLVHASKQGSVSLKTNDLENVQLTFENNKLDINFPQKEQIRNLLELEAEMKEEPLLKKLRTLKNLAEQLKQNRSTITISYNGQKMVTLGFEASPTLSQILTETDAIEINNPLQLIKLIK